MGKIKIIIVSLSVLIAISTNANAAKDLLQTDDFVGFSFWFVSLACLAATFFFFLERGSVAPGWTVSITVAGIVTGIAFVHSIYMRNIWVVSIDAPIIFRYLDWFITLPLLAIQFYLVPSAVKRVSPILFWKFLAASLVMVCGSYAGEAGYIDSFLGLVIWMVGWIFILYEIFTGEA